MSRLKGCPDVCVSIAWEYARLLWNLYRDTGPKRCHNSQTSRAQFPLNYFYTWCNMLLTGSHHSPVVRIPLIIPSTSFILPLHLPLYSSLVCTRVRGNHHNHQVSFDSQIDFEMDHIKPQFALRNYLITIPNWNVLAKKILLNKFSTKY